MSSSKNMKDIPFAVQWILKEYELKALKDSANGCLHSSYGSTLIGGIQYCLQIYPNGNRRENRGKCMVNFGVKMGDYKQIDTKYTVLIESANRSQDVTHTFKETKGWGKCFSETSEIFDPKKRFIVDGKMVLKVYGILKVERTENSPLCFGTLGNKLWENYESKDFKLIVQGKEIKVHKFILATVSPVFAEMFKTKNSSEMKITDYSIYVINFAMRNIYGCDLNVFISSNDLISLVQFFDKYDIHYLRDRYVKLHFRWLGKPLKDSEICKFEKYGTKGNVEIKSISKLGDKLWANNDYKDFKLIVEGKELKAHKLILALKSPRFSEMFKSNEGTDQIEISDFLYNTVKVALKAVYGCYNVVYNNQEKMGMLQFFEKYDFLFLKEFLEKVLIDQLSISNVCLLLNCSIASNATKLNEKCLDFLKIAVAAKISIADIIIIDKEINSNILQNPLYHTLETQRK